MMGAGVGAAAGGLRTPAEGDSRLRGMASGALRGAALGGAAGALGRGMRDTRLLSSTPLSAAQTVTGTAKRMGEGLANFGRRQVHGLTGAGNHDAIGMAGNATSARKAGLLEKRMKDELAHARTPTARARIEQQGQASMLAERTEGARSQVLADAGVTNLPGMARALTDKNKRGLALRAMGRSMVDGPGGLIGSVGVPTALALPGIMKGDERATGGLSTGQKVRNYGVNLATGAALGGLPMIPQMVAGTAVDAGLRRLGARSKQTQPLVRSSMLERESP
jgi:hypothetical protein